MLHICKNNFFAKVGWMLLVGCCRCCSSLLIQEDTPFPPTWGCWREKGPFTRGCNRCVCVCVCFSGWNKCRLRTSQKASCLDREFVCAREQPHPNRQTQISSDSFGVKMEMQHTCRSFRFLSVFGTHSAVQHCGLSHKTAAATLPARKPSRVDEDDADPSRNTGCVGEGTSVYTLFGPSHMTRYICIFIGSSSPISGFAWDEAAPKVFSGRQPLDSTLSRPKKMGDRCNAST